MPHYRVGFCLALSACSALAFCDNVKTWDQISQIGGPAFWGLGLGSSLVQDGRLGGEHAARTLDGFLVAGASSELIEHFTREKRPYSDKVDSFPSTHAALSFEIAASQSYFHPSQAPLWYGGAAVISYARVAGHRHHWWDVLAGAALGYAAGQLSASSRHGWITAPLVHPQERPAFMLGGVRF